MEMLDKINEITNLERWLFIFGGIFLGLSILFQTLTLDRTSETFDIHPMGTIFIICSVLVFMILIFIITLAQEDLRNSSIESNGNFTPITRTLLYLIILVAAFSVVFIALALFDLASISNQPPVT